MLDTILRPTAVYQTGTYGGVRGQGAKLMAPFLLDLGILQFLFKLYCIHKIANLFSLRQSDGCRNIVMNTT